MANTFTFSGTTAAGQKDTYTLDLPTAGRWVVECVGSANITAGLWLGTPVKGHGMLRVCGVGRRGSVNGLNPGNYSLTVENNSGSGAYTINVRKFGFLDNFTISSYKSTC